MCLYVYIHTRDVADARTGQALLEVVDAEGRLGGLVDLHPHLTPLAVRLLPALLLRQQALGLLFVFVLMCVLVCHPSAVQANQRLAKQSKRAHVTNLMPLVEDQHACVVGIRGKEAE